MIKNGKIVGDFDYNSVCVTSRHDNILHTKITVIFPDGHSVVSKSLHHPKEVAFLRERGCSKENVYIFEEICEPLIIKSKKARRV